jgi:hypothetical protein
MYGLNRESRIFDKILYEVDGSDIPPSQGEQFKIEQVCPLQ